MKTTVTDERLMTYINKLPMNVIWARAQWLGVDETEAIADLTCTAFGWAKDVTIARVLALVMAGGAR